MRNQTKIMTTKTAAPVEIEAIHWALNNSGSSVFIVPMESNSDRVNWQKCQAIVISNSLERMYERNINNKRKIIWQIKRLLDRLIFKKNHLDFKRQLNLKNQFGSYDFRMLDGQRWKWISISYHRLKIDSNSEWLALRISDVSDERYATTDIEMLSDRLRMALQAAQMGMYGDTIGLRRSFSPEAKLPGWQLNAAELYGIKPHEPAALHDLVARIHPNDQLGVFESYNNMMKSLGVTCTHEYRVLLPDGSLRWLMATAIAKREPNTGEVFSTGIVMDITERKQVEQRITHLANHDELTGLPSRKLFKELLVLALDRATNEGINYCLMFIDLDRFKVINDTLGHNFGDQLLQAISNRFKLALRPDDLVGRLGGDEFVVLAAGVQGSKNATLIANKLLQAAAEPLILNGQECNVGVSIGICLIPAHGLDALQLLQRADLAMYQAKEHGGNTYRIYDEDSPNAERNMQIELHLTKALARNEFNLVFQPQFNLDGEIIGVEALLRWNSQYLGNVSPAHFIPVAEETGIIVKIGAWVIEEACLAARSWLDAGLKPIRMAVNISARQFQDSGFLSVIQNAIRASGLDPRYLEIEITEGAVIRNPVKSVAILKKIRELNIRVAIDDFGTGYSSLSQLRMLPLDVLKIDRSFITNIHSDKDAQAITGAISGMGKALRLEIVAEGIESHQEALYLKENTTCDIFQGYYFSRPVSAEGIALRLTA